MHFSRTQISRTQSVILAVSLIFGFIVIAYLLSTNSTAPPRSDLAREIGQADQIQSKETTDQLTLSPTTPEQESNFVLNNFNRSEIKDGRKVWEVKAEQGQYYPESNSAQLRNATIWFFRPNGKTVQLDTLRGTIFLVGSTLDRGLAEGDVQVKLSEKVTITTETANYSHTLQRLASESPVHIDAGRLQIDGIGLDGDLATQQFTLLQDVRTVIEPIQKQQ